MSNNEAMQQLDTIVTEMVLGLEEKVLAQQAITDEINAIYNKAKTCGLNTKVMRKLVRDRSATPALREGGSVAAQYMQCQAEILAGSVTAPPSASAAKQTDIEEKIAETPAPRVAEDDEAAALAQKVAQAQAQATENVTGTIDQTPAADPLEIPDQLKREPEPAPQPAPEVAQPQPGPLEAALGDVEDQMVTDPETGEL